MVRVAAAPQPVESMTDRQLARRRALLSTVMDLALERGIDHVQMKLVAERSGVALGTTYRYFASKDHLLAAALGEWHGRLTQRVLAGDPHFADDKARINGLVDFLHRGMRGFQEYPNYADLLMYVGASRDPFAGEAFNEMSLRNDDVLRFFLGPAPSEAQFTTMSFVIGSVWHNAILVWRAGRMPLAEANAQCEEAVRLACAGLASIMASDTPPGGRPDRVA